MEAWFAFTRQRRRGTVARLNETKLAMKPSSCAEFNNLGPERRSLCAGCIWSLPRGNADTDLYAAATENSISVWRARRDMRCKGRSCRDPQPQLLATLVVLEACETRGMDVLQPAMSVCSVMQPFSPQAGLRPSIMSITGCTFQSSRSPPHHEHQWLRFSLQTGLRPSIMSISGCAFHRKPASGPAS